MENNKVACPGCDESDAALDRRDFLRAVGVTTAAAAAGLWAVPRAHAAPTPKSAAETAVKALYDKLTAEQRKAVCFEWDYKDPKRGLLRTFVSNNWQVTPQHIRSDFYTREQQAIAYDVWKGIINPEWEKKFLKQLKDDTDGAEWGAEQSLAIFGTPGSDKFELVMTGRHMTLRADGNSQASVAFGGPVFYGHAASGFNEKVHHPGNVFWHQAEEANKVYQMLDGKQRKLALVAERPAEAAVAFRGNKGGFPGVPVAEMAADQKKELQRVLMVLLEQFRKEDQQEALECLKKQGGLDKCALAFYQDGDLGNDQEWDNWRLEGPSFVWYFRGEPHVHVWVNIADDPSVALNARG
jgi:hypothetical protein